MRALVLLVAVTITAAYANSFLKDEYLTVKERKQAMDEAIEEATAAMTTMELARKHRVITQNEKNGNYTSFQLLNKFFKRPSEEAKIIGKANRLYRDIVNKAQKKILEMKHAKFTTSQSPKARAESMAELLFTTPGSMLTSQEIAHSWKIARNMFYAPKYPVNCYWTPNVHLFRTINGICNNLDHPQYGSAGIAFKRLVAPSYEDGFSSPHGSLQAQNILNDRRGNPFLPPYPSARFISENVVCNANKDEGFTHLLMQFGQFLDHDLDLSPVLEGHCDPDKFTDYCQPIKISALDKTYGAETCNDGKSMPFHRSATIMPNDPPLTFTPLEQFNDVTSFIDGSMIYGADKTKGHDVRTHKDGMLKEGIDHPRKPSLPPTDGENQVECPKGECFLCGDRRCNEQISLTIMHTIWLREHNRCAGKMAINNPDWDDEQLFQVCRKIVGALIQKITYDDYLPKILGKTYDTFIKKYTEYNKDVDPSIPNSFSTAAYRYGHSLIRPAFDRFGKYYLPLSPLKLEDAFFTPELFKSGSGTDPIMRGWVATHSRRMDEFMSTVLTTKLFMRNGQGLDLASLNLHRGRDHGLAPYSVYKNFCFKKFMSTSDFENDLTFVRFLELYGSLNTADLWIAGLAEKRLDTALVGATFACIFGLTFQAVRDGDRFFWLNPGVFNKKQIESIGGDSFSRIICENSDGIETIQRDAFTLADRKDRVSCDELKLKGVDFTLFKPCSVSIEISPTSVGVIYIASYSAEKYPTYHPVRFIPSNDQFQCISIQCPTQSTFTRIFVFPSWQQLSLTTVTSNKDIPKSYSASSHYYIADVTHSYFDQHFGLFAGENCERSAGTAFTIDMQEADIDSDQMLERENTNMRLESMAKLASDTDENWLNEIKEKLESENPIMRLESMAELASVTDPTGVKKIINKLEPENPTMRLESMAKLASVTDPTGVKKIINKLEPENPTMRMAELASGTDETWVIKIIGDLKENTTMRLESMAELASEDWLNDMIQKLNPKPPNMGLELESMEEEFTSDLFDSAEMEKQREM